MVSLTATAAGHSPRAFRLADWLVQPSLDTLSRGETVVHLRPKVMDVLVLLAEHAGEVVAKETIIDAVWAKKFLADSALTRAVFELREALGDEAHGSRYVETIPKRGYRLVAPVTDVLEAAPAREPPPASAARPSRRPLALAAVGVSLLALLLWAVIRARPDRSTQAAAKAVRIVVLPFENLGRAEDDDLAAGLTDEITGRLASVPGLAVISPATASHYAGTTKATAEIARELAVDYLVGGTVRWSTGAGAPERVRITPRLVRAADDTQLWAEVYDRGVQDIFELQSEIARGVVGRVGFAVGPAPSGPGERMTASVEAYQAYLRGLSLWSMDARSEPDLRLAVAAFERAATLDPGFALAHAEAARVRSVLYHFGFERSEENRAKARTAIATALALEPRSGGVRLASGLHRYWCYRDYEGALAELGRARAGLGPTAEVLEAQALVLRRMGRWEESARLFQQTIELNQRSWVVAFDAGDTFAFMRRYDDAKRLLERAISLAPDEPDPHGYLAHVILLRGGSVAEARRALEAMPQPRGARAAAYWFRQEACEGRFQAALERVAGGDFAILENSLMWRPKELLLAQGYRHLERAEDARPAFEAGREVTERELRARPDDFRLYSALALGLAGLGRKDEAVAAGLRGTELCPLASDALSGSSALLDLAQVYTMVGEPTLACTTLDRLLSVPSLISVPLLQLDPVWAPLRAQPCFAELVRRHGSG